MQRRRFLRWALLGTLMAASACSRGDDGGATPRGRRGTPLRSPGLAAGMTLAAAMAQRRSVREYTDDPLAGDDVAQLLWAAQGVSSENGLRTAPSAGALYPLTAYAALADGLFRYEPAGHRTARTSTSDLRDRLAQAAFGQDWIGRAPAVFAIGGNVSRSAGRYGGRAERYVFLEAGHAAQNLLLQAVSLGLAGVPVGAFDDDEVHRLLLMPEAERPVYLLPVGRPRSS